MAKSTPNQNRAYAALAAGAVALNLFWFINLCKEVNSGVKGFLNFYPPVGPLLGLFLLSIIVFILALLVFSTVFRNPLGEGAKKTIATAYVISAILFFIMVFPPVFEPIVDLLSGK